MVKTKVEQYWLVIKINNAGSTNPPIGIWYILFPLDKIIFSVIIIFMIKPPVNYRKLGNNEKYTTGDWYRHINDNMSDTITRDCNYGNVSDYPSFEFWRRRHTKKKVNVFVKPKAKNKKTVVYFRYNGVGRNVQLISLDNNYLKGLEIVIDDNNKTTYQFKTFKRYKILGVIELVSYEPSE
jgi:hypothetical protein